MAQTREIEPEDRRLMKADEAPDRGAFGGEKTTFVDGIQSYSDGSAIGIEGWVEG